MKNPGDGTNGGAQLAKRNELATISERKLKANRENAKNSTGPRTLRGKAFSRRNALKHGLFARHFMDFDAQGEDPKEYEELLNGLWDEYQPIGKAEELEVQRVALCWWRLKRAWRNENVVNRVALRDFGRRELGEQAEYCKTLDKEEEDVILQLQSAKKEIEVTGEISQELKQRIFAMMPGFESIWWAIERSAQERLKEPAVSKIFRKLSPQEHSSVLASHAVTRGIDFLEQLGQWRWISVREIAIGQHVVPNRDALDKILRYEGAIQRELGRAVDRLERLQRRRQGEPVPPPVSVRLTR
jgi:hypothetical protein